MYRGKVLQKFRLISLDILDYSSTRLSDKAVLYHASLDSCKVCPCTDISTVSNIVDLAMMCLEPVKYGFPLIGEHALDSRCNDNGIFLTAVLYRVHYLCCIVYVVSCTVGTVTDTFAAGYTVCRIYGRYEFTVFKLPCYICFGSRTGTDARCTAYALFGLYDYKFFHIIHHFLKSVGLGFGLIPLYLLSLNLVIVINELFLFSFCRSVGIFFRSERYIYLVLYTSQAAICCPLGTVRLAGTRYYLIHILIPFLP